MKEHTGKAISKLCFGFFSATALISLLLTPQLKRLDPSYTEGVPDLVAKLATFESRASDYDLVMIGDSRTYCGLAARYLDPLLGRKSFNLGYWAHWLPTQVVMLRDLALTLEPGTTILWSLSHDDFIRRSQAINTIYPVKPGHATWLLQQGFAWSDLQENLLRFTPGLGLYAERTRIRTLLDQGLSSQLSALDSKNAVDTARNWSAYVELEAALKGNNDVLLVQPVFDQGLVTSAVSYGQSGDYVRHELVPDYFRAKQNVARLDLKTVKVFEPDPLLWQLFLTTLDMLRAKGISVIVNEMELAPYHYQVGPSGEAYRRFMATLANEVKARGIPYVRADFARLTDSDYFDFTHLNQNGATTYARLLAEVIRPILAQGSAKGSPHGVP